MSKTTQHQRPPSADVMEMMEQGAMQQAQGQKTNVPTATQPADPKQSSQPFQHQQKPRDVGTFQEEAKQAVADIAEGLRNLPFDIIKDILGLNREPKTPEEMAKLQQFHQGWQQLSSEQQQVAGQRLQAEEQRQEMFAQMEEEKKQQEDEAKKQNDLVVPQGKVSGQAAMQKMQQDRKGMGGASG